MSNTGPEKYTLLSKPQEDSAEKKGVSCLVAHREGISDSRKFKTQQKE